MARAVLRAGLVVGMVALVIMALAGGPVSLFAGAVMAGLATALALRRGAQHRYFGMRPSLAALATKCSRIHLCAMLRASR